MAYNRGRQEVAKPADINTNKNTNNNLHVVFTPLLKCFRNIKISILSKLQYHQSIETKCVKWHGKRQEFAIEEEYE